MTLSSVLPSKLEQFGLLEIARQLSEEVYRRQQAPQAIIPARFGANGQQH